MSSTPDPDCPSCFGGGWATIRVGGITVASGQCRCSGGDVWAVVKKRKWPDDFRGFGTNVRPKKTK